MRYTVRPISDRTPFYGDHEYTPFRVAWASTLKLLGRELEYLAATDVVIEVDCGEGQIRLDGMLRADAKVSSPAVRIAFGSKHGPLTYATDRYTGRYYGGNADWQENVRAIALALEALRKVDRYGVTRHGEQYAGWKQIEARSSMTREAALAVIERWSPEARDAPVERRLRWAKAGAHPDRHGGDREAWDAVETAARVLGVS